MKSNALFRTVAYISVRTPELLLLRSIFSLYKLLVYRPSTCRYNHFALHLCILSQLPILLLPRSVPAVHPQIRPRHERASITDQEHCSAPILLGSRQTSQHILLWPLLLSLRVLLEELLYHCCHNVPWRDGVDPDVMQAPFGRQVSTELDYTCFGCVVCRANKPLLTLLAYKTPLRV